MKDDNDKDILNSSDDSEMSYDNQVMIVNSVDELFQIINQLIGVNCLSSDEFNQMIENEFNQIIENEFGSINEQLSNKSENLGIDVWGKSFRNDQRDVHMYNGVLTNMMRSVFDRIH